VGFFEETDESWRPIFEGEHPQRCSPRPSLPGEDAEPENGAIIFVSSESAINPSPEMPHYGATKTPSNSGSPETSPN
jgi:3-oxoacyl-[acyl-carrier protein] reductase